MYEVIQVFKGRERQFSQFDPWASLYDRIPSGDPTPPSELCTPGSNFSLSHRVLLLWRSTPTTTNVRHIPAIIPHVPLIGLGHRWPICLPYLRYTLMTWLRLFRLRSTRGEQPLRTEKIMSVAACSGVTTGPSCSMK